MPKPRSIIYGAGGHARELAFQLEAAGTQVLAFVDDFNSDRLLDGTPVVSYEKAITMAGGASWFVAIGSIEGRVRLVQRLSSSGTRFGTFVSPRAVVSPTARIGQGVQVFANVVISANVNLGDHVIVNYGAVLHHDVKIGSFGFIAANSTIAGHVEVGSRVWIGAGSVIRNGVDGSPMRVGDGAVVGAAACVISNVDPGLTVIGVPAKPRSSREK
ncbi:acetyltransferase [Microvirga sp. HBU67558]|uniref:acetyltransferase n=1 Tax=Microvirga TaxID=186650 RepID=UPI001B35CCC4|nr:MULTISPECIES: acetyltransferase [unclassified Microvirga]MBQ0819618.1 acetyltransferase [Microvirga sp. HBU67558]